MEGKNKIRSFTHSETFNIYITYIQEVLKEKRYQSTSTPRNMHILFYEQAVCGNGTKVEKVLNDDERK